MPKLESQELLKVINAIFKQYTGKPMTMLVYDIDDLQKRVANIEQTLRQTMPVMAATAVKMEALIDEASVKGIVSRDSIDVRSNKLLTTIK